MLFQFQDILFDLNTAKPVENVCGCFVLPIRFSNDDWDDLDDEE